MIDPSKVKATICGKEIEPFGVEVYATSPLVALPFVLDSEADRTLCAQLKRGGLVGELFRAGNFSFRVKRVRRIVDSLRPGEAVWEFWE